jgi:hypothetical protein
LTEVLVRPQQARQLAAQDEAHLPEGDRTKQPLEPLAPLGGDGSARPEVGIDDGDLLEAQAGRSLGDCVLQCLTLEVVAYLALRGLPQVHDRTVAEGP